MDGKKQQLAIQAASFRSGEHSSQHSEPSVLNQCKRNHARRTGRTLAVPHAPSATGFFDGPLTLLQITRLEFFQWGKESPRKAKPRAIHPLNPRNRSRNLPPTSRSKTDLGLREGTTSSTERQRFFLGRAFHNQGVWLKINRSEGQTAGILVHANPLTWATHLGIPLIFFGARAKCSPSEWLSPRRRFFFSHLDTSSWAWCASVSIGGTSRTSEPGAGIHLKWDQPKRFRQPQPSPTGKKREHRHTHTSLARLQPGARQGCAGRHLWCLSEPCASLVDRPSDA